MDPTSYAELIERQLNSCDGLLEEPPHFISDIEITGKAFFWTDTLRFKDEHILKVVDSTVFGDDGKMAIRSFSYDFRRNGEAEPVFRIDNHNRPQSAAEPCHVHLSGLADRVECFPNSAMTDFPFVLHCIKNYYLEKKQYWDNGGANEPNE